MMHSSALPPLCKKLLIPVMKNWSGRGATGQTGTKGVSAGSGLSGQREGRKQEPDLVKMRPLVRHQLQKGGADGIGVVAVDLFKEAVRHGRLRLEKPGGRTASQWRKAMSSHGGRPAALLGASDPAVGPAPPLTHPSTVDAMLMPPMAKK